MLNQSKFTDLVTIGSIDVGQDVTLDTIASLENKTVRNVLRSALFVSNSILFIKDNIVTVARIDHIIDLFSSVSLRSIKYQSMEMNTPMISKYIKVITRYYPDQFHPLLKILK